MPAHIFIATSLDGYIARPDGAIDWLPAASGQTADAEPENHGYDAFMSTVDAVVMGRHTYETVLGFGGWHFTKPVVVLSSREVAIAPELKRKVIAMRGAPAEVMRDCAARGWHSLYVDGGVTVQRFLAAGLVERVIVTRIPVLIGAGIPLFGSVPRDVRLEHVRTQAYPSGLVQSEYRVAQPLRAS
jgi:dihydrofolate reductase